MNKTKDVKSYSSSDLSQILGFSVPAKQQDESLIAKDSIAQYSPADSLKSSRKAVKRDGTDSPADSAKASKKRGETGDNKVKEGKKGQEEQRKGDEGDKKERVRDPVLPKTVLTGILMHMFQHGGFLSNGKPVEQDWIFVSPSRRDTVFLK